MVRREMSSRSNSARAANAPKTSYRGRQRAVVVSMAEPSTQVVHAEVNLRP